MNDLLINLVQQTSLSTQESAAVNYLVDWMGAHGFEAWIDAAGNACGIKGEPHAPHLLILLGHIDTVGGEIPVRVENGILHGRGSVDAKGSLAAFAAATAEATIPAGWRVLVVGAVEEEIASSKGAHFIRDQYQPELCIIGEPSGVDCVTLGYKGRLLLDYTYSRPMSHTARLDQSAGAVGSAFWQAIVTWAEQQNQGHEKLFDQLMPHLHSINTSSDGLTEGVQLKIGFRLPPHWSPDQVIAAVTALNTWGGDITCLSGEPAYRGEKNNVLVRGLLAAIRSQGQTPRFVLKTGTSDMNVVGQVWTCPIVAYGPGDSSLDHTPEEHILLADYQQAIRTLVQFIEQLT